METKRYKPQMGIFWWMTRWSSIKFISRELTSVAVAFYSVVSLLYVRSILNGEAAYIAFTSRLKSPMFIALNFFVLACLLFHSITWFNLAPQAMVVKIGDKKVPGLIIALMNYAGWLFISIAILWLAISK